MSPAFARRVGEAELQRLSDVGQFVGEALNPAQLFGTEPLGLGLGCQLLIPVDVAPSQSQALGLVVRLVRSPAASPTFGSRPPPGVRCGSQIDLSTNAHIRSRNSPGGRSSPLTYRAAGRSKLPANTDSRPHTSCSYWLHRVRSSTRCSRTGTAGGSGRYGGPCPSSA